MTVTIGFLINPIAGMGGKVGLKGTDNVYKEAVSRGATPVAAQRAQAMLEEFQRLQHSPLAINWVSCGEEMGAQVLSSAGISPGDIVYHPSENTTTSEDTKQACQIFLEKNVDLLVFCGGDGTACDIYSVVKDQIPILGIPSGVKMHSAIFGITPQATAKILVEFVDDSLTLGEAEIMDLDEEKYRKGEWNIKLFGIAKGIVEPTYVQVGKQSFASVSDTEIKDDLADHIADELKNNPEYLYLFGSGGTIDYIAKKLGLKNTLLGIDAVYQKKIIGTDLNERGILNVIHKYPQVKLLLSPIGAQGFILGRGNLQLSPKVLAHIDPDNVLVISTPAKLKNTPILRVDTSDAAIDKKYQQHGFFMVVIGYRLSRIVKIQANNV